MHLSRIELQGFKSFAERTILHLRPGLTAVVGPNGSGKSNIADAVRWVLGEQSTKTLRGHESTDMIFSGSAKRARLGMAQVSLVLDNSDHTAPIDVAEIVLTRKLSRSGESEYFINKQSVRLLDIILFLARANFGQKSYAVVGQGMIDHFLHATPEERKVYFDEAVGVKEFQLKRDSAVRKLLRTEENLLEANRLLDEIEPRLRSLTRQVKKLERREAMEANLLDLQLPYYGAQWKTLTNALSQQKEQENIQQQEHQRLERAIETLQTKSDALARGNDQAATFRHLQEEQSRLELQKNNLVHQQVILRGQLEIEHQKHGGQEEAWLARRQQQLTSEQHQFEQERAAIPAKLHSLETSIQQHEAEHQRVQEQIKETEYQLLKIQHHLHDEGGVAIATVQSDLKRLHREYRSLVHKLQATRDATSLASLQNHASKILEEFDQILERIHATTKKSEPHDAHALSDQLKQLTRTKQELLTLVTTANLEHRRLQDRSKELERMTTAIAAEQSEIETKLKSRGGQPAMRTIKQQDKELQHQIDQIDKQLAKTQTQMNAFHQTQQEAKRKLLELQHEARDQQQTLNRVSQELQEVRVEIARLETRREDLENEITHETIASRRAEIQAWNGKPSSIDTEEMDLQIQRLKKQLEQIGGIDPETMEEYEQTNERFTFMTRERNDLTTAMAQLHAMIDELDETIKKRFQSTFQKINQDFQHYFKILFGGGRATLELLHEVEGTDTEQAAETAETSVPQTDKNPSHRLKRKIISGITIDAQPPGKKLQTLSALSGGEKALTSIALISAIMHNNPSPFVILDEVDAALDEANSERFSNILDELRKKTQFIVITHNRAVMSRADILYGVSMGTDGVSELLSVKLSDLSDRLIGK